MENRHTHTHIHVKFRLVTSATDGRNHIFHGPSGQTIGVSEPDLLPTSNPVGSSTCKPLISTNMSVSLNVCVGEVSQERSESDMILFPLLLFSEGNITNEPISIETGAFLINFHQII